MRCSTPERSIVTSAYHAHAIARPIATAYKREAALVTCIAMRKADVPFGSKADISTASAVSPAPMTAFGQERTSPAAVQVQASRPRFQRPPELS